LEIALDYNQIIELQQEIASMQLCAALGSSPQPCSSFGEERENFIPKNLSILPASPL